MHIWFAAIESSTHARPGGDAIGEIDPAVQHTCFPATSAIGACRNHVAVSGEGDV